MHRTGYIVRTDVRRGDRPRGRRLPGATARRRPPAWRALGV